ncbi:ferric-chelate reductase 1-like, partial [Saccoglossus kowalevskii]
MYLFLHLQMREQIRLFVVVVYTVCFSSYEVLALVDAIGCGEHKGCFQYPDGCQDAECELLVTWQAVTAGIDTEFGIIGKLTSEEHYVGIGFSHNQQMHDADVWACLQLADSSIVLDHSYNLANVYGNVQTNTTGATNLTAAFDNGVLECTFTRLNKLEDPQEPFFDLTAMEYYLMVPRGPRDDTHDPPKLKKHIEIPIVSNEKINFTLYSTYGGDVNLPTLPKVHGSLMMFGWIVCASIAIICARYYKPMWPGRQLLGQKVWFTFHRSLMVINVVCFSAAFVVIFVHVGGWVIYTSTSDKQFIHATIGCIVVGLGLTNPIMALFRPHPTNDNRWIFNWAHFSVGTSAHILAMFNVYLGMELLNLPSYSKGVFVGWICFHFVMEICLEIMNCVNKES